MLLFVGLCFISKTHSYNFISPSGYLPALSLTLKLKLFETNYVVESTSTASERLTAKCSLSWMYLSFLAQSGSLHWRPSAKMVSITAGPCACLWGHLSLPLSQHTLSLTSPKVLSHCFPAESRRQTQGRKSGSASDLRVAAISGNRHCKLSLVLRQ